MPKVLFIEPFYGGSHKTLIDTLIANLPLDSYTLITLPAKKWHWRARCGALILSNLIPKVDPEDVLFCSSVLNLTELLGLRPDLHPLKKVVYFHENQLIYPVQEIKERDVQYSYNQIITSLSADVVLFNSEFNKSSFLSNIGKILKLIPDHRPKGLREQIEVKSQVLYFPMKFPVKQPSTRDDSCLHIVWPHRWEFDKGPRDFFDALTQLKECNCNFKVSVLGETFSDNHEVFTQIKENFIDEIAHFGYVKSKEEYFNILRSCHVVISTAKHEFFGVSMLEAAYCGCFPLVPNNLVYPEIYPHNCLYTDGKNLVEKLKYFCANPKIVSKFSNELSIDFSKYSKDTLLPFYLNILGLDNK